jgi:hypothetical protein
MEYILSRGRPFHRVFAEEHGGEYLLDAGLRRFRRTVLAPFSPALQTFVLVILTWRLFRSGKAHWEE